MTFFRLNIYALFLFLISSTLLSAQDEQIRYQNYVYVDNIFSVRFHITDLFNTHPIIDMNSGATLTLSFDDLDADVKDYFYTIEHCDIDWQPSILEDMEYIDGFIEERINDFEFSFKTFWPYTHYELTLPNGDMEWTKAGNYLLKIYDDTRDRKLVLTRRFVVIDPQVQIAPNVVRANQVSKLRTHQEIDFNVDHEQLNINNPVQEVRAVILQNGRWDNAITGLPPKFVRPNTMIFDYQNKVVFPGLKEFRNLDLRSLRRVPFNVFSVKQSDDGFLVQLKTDQRRDQLAYTTFNDLNGNYIIGTTDQKDKQLSSEYVDVFFELEADRYLDADIYLYGALTDWRIQESFRMEYDQTLNAYLGAALLKQGYYDYAYVAVPNSYDPSSFADQPEPSFEAVEGNSNETLNEYTIIIYYKPFGSRYDIPIGSLTFSSN